MRILTEQAQADRDDFESEYGSGNCSCHINPPCNSCIHPGNPLNQDDFDECWEELVDGEPCSHKGCLNHVMHACDHCGRIGGRNE